MHVLVKWKNYDEPTWEKFVGLAQDAPHAIQKYWINYEKKYLKNWNNYHNNGNTKIRKYQ